MTAAALGPWPTTSPTATATREPPSSTTSYQSPPAEVPSAPGRYSAASARRAKRGSCCGRRLRRSVLGIRRSAPGRRDAEKHPAFGARKPPRRGKADADDAHGPAGDDERQRHGGREPEGGQ